MAEQKSSGPEAAEGMLMLPKEGYVPRPKTTAIPTGPDFVIEVPDSRWVALDRSTAVRVTVDSKTGEARQDALVAYGKIFRERLNGVDLRLRPDFSSALHFERTPTEEEVSHLWEVQTSVQVIDIKTFEKRRPQETTDEFYQRVADLFRVLQVTSNAPTKSLAEAAGLDPEAQFHTAVYWVRQARKRGFLPRSSRQLPEERQ